MTDEPHIHIKDPPTTARSRRLLFPSLLLIGVLAVVALTGWQFLAMHEDDPIVEGLGVTDTGLLSDYVPQLKGTPGDTTVYIFEGEQPGGIMLALGGVHPNEIAGVLAATILVENAEVSQGKLIVIPRSNASGFTHNLTSSAAPQYITIETPWGQRKFRYGSRLTNPLHQFPDPDVYVHHSTGSLGAGSEARNLNRNFPGHSNGTLTERIAYGITELIRKEGVDLVLDMHEARPMNPIVNAVVAHERASEITSFAILDLQLFDNISMRIEPSASGFRGVSNQELGDHTSAYAVLSETPQVAMDWPIGPISEELVLSGRDKFIKRAADHGGLVYVEYNHEMGLPIQDRVGRHLSTFLSLVDGFSDLHPERQVSINNIPRYGQVIENGVGYYLKQPSR